MSQRGVRSLWRDFVKQPEGILGLSILILLIIATSIALTSLPPETFREWSNPTYWVRYPKTAEPAWVNFFSSSKQPEHLILQQPAVNEDVLGEFRRVIHSYTLDYSYDDFPNDINFNYFLNYGATPPQIELRVTRPDGEVFSLVRTTAPSPPAQVAVYRFNGTISSAERILRNTVLQQSSKPNCPASALNDTRANVLIFQVSCDKFDEGSRLLRGRYTFESSFFLFGSDDRVQKTELIIGGKVFGFMGTDDLGRDIWTGVLWGTPVALFIGITVSIFGTGIGLIYGVASGYFGGKTDEVMMRFSDIIISFPLLFLLIIIAVSTRMTLGLLIVILVVFGWPGLSKVTRSIALQLKTLPYVEASQLIGASSRWVMIRHMVPQITPYVIASVALSVPGPILTEAGLSFLGLGDPTVPTWGKILNDAYTFGAGARQLWWWIMPPGVMLALTAISFVLIGNGLDKVLNPKMRKL
ncbi:MAG: ABC transporter permease [Thaumarchaeota archaeon]|nr:ABC transporter permease [Nitrososphaerota archaeon]